MKNHECHWPGCTIDVPAKHWGCNEHWALLPNRLKVTILAAYVPGQDLETNPSPAYVSAANALHSWINQEGDSV